LPRTTASYLPLLLQADPGNSWQAGRYDDVMPARWFQDTDRKALDVYLGLHREMEPGDRLARVFELCGMQESLQQANVRATFPAAGDSEVFLRVAARRLGRNLMIQAYGWDPDLHS
jgi:hypothetical protein